MKSGNLNFHEPSGSLQACNGTALLFYFPLCAELTFEVFISLLKCSNGYDLAMSKHVAVLSGVVIIHTSRYTVIVSYRTFCGHYLNTQRTIDVTIRLFSTPDRSFAIITHYQLRNAVTNFHE
jgi:hypothetical protein